MLIAGLHLTLKGRNIDDGSSVSITDVGVKVEDAALVCQTDLQECCNTENGGSQQGNWFFPNNQSAIGKRKDGDFFVSRDAQKVLLQRKGNIQGPLGAYCCKVKTAEDVVNTICVNLSK